jgi:hypothetical protein
MSVPYLLIAGAIGIVPEGRRFPVNTDLPAIEHQRTKSTSTSISGASPTPLPTTWHGFVPLESTRADVERVLGKPEKSLYSTSIYNTAHDRIDVLYSEGPCEASEAERWNVSRDVIIRIYVRPRYSLRVNALVLDKKKYIRTRDSHPNNWFTYWNNADGIRVEAIKTDQLEEVNSISYGPRTKDHALRCP